MMESEHNRPDPDRLLQEIADYVLSDAYEHPDALGTARLSLLDSLGCALQALQYPACTKLLGPFLARVVLVVRAYQGLRTSLIRSGPLSISER
jgi:2-methylcitrate dehydratase PrpD